MQCLQGCGHKASFGMLLILMKQIAQCSVLQTNEVEQEDGEGNTEVCGKICIADSLSDCENSSEDARIT